MTDRTPVLAAGVAGLTAFVLCLVLGSETFFREVLLEIDRSPSVDATVRVLSVPRWFDSFGGAGFRFAFLLGFPVAVAVLCLAVVRRGNAFVAGWVVAVAGGALVGLLRGLITEDRLRGPVRGVLDLGYSFAGDGAVFGLLSGWILGLACLLASTMAGPRDASPTARTAPPPGQPGSTTGWSSPPAAGASDVVPPTTPSPTTPSPDAPPPPAAPPPSTSPHDDPTRPSGPSGG